MARLPPNIIDCVGEVIDPKASIVGIRKAFDVEAYIQEEALA